MTMATLFDAKEIPVKLNPKLRFSDFLAAYPKRYGPNPRALAEKRFAAAVASGVDPERLINSAKAYADELREMGKLGTEFVCHASTWINQKRYLDYAPDPGNKEREAKMDEEMRKRGFKWEGDRWVKI